MIHQDEQGNRFVQMSDGGKAPLIDIGIRVKLETVVEGQIVEAPVALAVMQSAAAYWRQKYEHAQTTIADLREQLAAKG